MKNSKTGKLYHIAIAVNDLEVTEQLWQDSLGLKVVHREVVEEQGVRASMLEPEDGGAAIELLEPLGDDSPIAKFLEKRGEGIHHICFYVNDIASALERLKEQGVRLIDQEPRQGAHYAKVAFLHPKAMGGVLVELAEKEEKEKE